MSGPNGEIDQAAPVVDRVRGLSLRSKVVLATVGSGALVAGILTSAFFVQTRDAMTEELRERGQTAAIGLSSNLAFSLFSGDIVGLSRVAQTTMADVPDVAYVVVRDRAGKALAEAIQPELTLARFTAADVPVLSVARNRRTADRLVDLRGTSLLAVEAPVLIEQHARVRSEDALLDPASLVESRAAGAEAPERQVIGAIQIGLKLGTLQENISRIASRAVLLGLLAMLGCALVAYLLARLVTEPVERLTRAAAGIARGDLEQDILAAGSDEIGELAWSFETMTSGLKGMIADLRSASQDVEREAGRILSTSSKQTVVANQQSVAINETRSSANEIARASKTAT
ncbi:MAG TPA: methyl-accepting chemotaxis protein, partial [Myxococcales bacterium]|nr:methyl-accepting chemotaxis protein [Myxococcales bacterium]